MGKFIFRNNTLESLFNKDYQFSGYDDISYIPQNVDQYIWWYQLPIKFETKVIVDEVKGYVQKLKYVLNQTDSSIPFIILTLDILFDVQLTDDSYELQRAVYEYNQTLYELEKQYSKVKVIDVSQFYRKFAVKDLVEWKYYFISQMSINPKLSKDFKIWWNHKLQSVELKRKKCLVLDLDNTLWGGVLGEDGIDGIKIGGEYPGKAFLYWQEALLELSKNGIILAVCSKNNEQDVLDVWDKNPYILLKKEHFAAYRINWNDKATNIKELATELNLGLDSFVFVDDNPTERELIKQTLPMVSVPDFPTQPYELLIFFKELVDTYFKIYSITEEDKRKTEQYKENAARTKAQNEFTDLESFLKSLNIQVILEKANEFNIQRIAQMTQKTNQFNLTTHRYTDADIHSFVDSGWNVWCISVSDKFGDSGITGAIIIKPNGEIDTLLLSCRILGKGIEFAFIKKMLEILKQSGFVTLTAKYIPTIKNSQVMDFWDKVGFDCVATTDNGCKEYKIDLATANTGIKSYYNIIIK
jgi:FkbH-like protein